MAHPVTDSNGLYLSSAVFPHLLMNACLRCSPTPPLSIRWQASSLAFDRQWNSFTKLIVSFPSSLSLPRRMAPSRTCPGERGSSLLFVTPPRVCPSHFFGIPPVLEVFVMANCPERDTTIGSELYADLGRGASSFSLGSY